MHVVFGAAGALGAAIVQNLAQPSVPAQYPLEVEVVVKS
jgi:hypothetical protein